MTPPEDLQRDAARRKRDARIRWQLLQSMHLVRSNSHGGWITGRGLVESIAWCGPDYRLDPGSDDEQAQGLLADLCGTGYAKVEDNREDRSQPYTLDYITFRITDKGIRFVNRAEPPDAMIDDGRIVKQ